MLFFFKKRKELCCPRWFQTLTFSVIFIYRLPKLSVYISCVRLIRVSLFHPTAFAQETNQPLMSCFKLFLRLCTLADLHLPSCQTALILRKQTAVQEVVSCETDVVAGGGGGTT